MDFKFSVDEIVKTKNSDLLITNIIIIENKTRRKYIYYNYKCLNCGNEDKIRQDHLINKHGCNVCKRSPSKVLVGYNDIATTHPNIVEYFKNKEDAFKFSAKSDKKVYFICPKCDFIKESTPHLITKRGFNCPKCGDGISYPNKFIFNLMSQMKGQNQIKDFEREVKFKWCKFKKYKSEEEYHNGIYDIVIKEKKLIIEMDGIWHNNYNPFSSQTEEESIYIDRMKDLLAKQNGYKVIRIDCKYKDVSKRFDYIKESIINSYLFNMFNFEYINWKKVNIACINSLKYEICDYKNKNKKSTSSEISKIFGISRTTVATYLKDCAKLGLCEYDAENEKKLASKRNGFKNRQKINVIKDGMILKTYNSKSELYKKSREDFGVILHLKGVDTSVKEDKEYKGYKFSLI